MARTADRPHEPGRSETTSRLLKEHGLKRLAKRDPAEAIRALDRLRADNSAAAEALTAAIAEVAFEAGGEASADAASGFFLCAAFQTRDAALEHAASGNAETREDLARSARLHRAAVESLIGSLDSTPAPLLPGQPQQIEGPLISYELSWLGADATWTLATHEFVAASALRDKRKHVDADRPGLGAPVVAVQRDDIPEDLTTEGGTFPIYQYFYPLTAVLEFVAGATGEQRVKLELLDPYLVDTHTVEGVEYPLAIDIGAQFAALRREVDTKVTLSALIRSGKHMSLAGLYLVEPPRAEKTPLVLVHGLASEPQTWIQAFEALQLIPEIRRGYQVSLFAYPSGLHFGYSAMLLRRSLDRLTSQLEGVGALPESRRMILVGHSMGGLLVRMQIVDSGLKLWETVFVKAPEEVDLPPEDVALLSELLIVEPLPYVDRVVFFATPHRGSKFADNVLGELGSALIALPRELQELGKRVVAAAPESLSETAADRAKVADSVQTLEPDNPLIQALSQLEIDSGVTYHTVVGDQGKGDTPDSSDGLVPYWSSHLEGVASERIVPSGHGSHHHPEGIDELRRILLEHLDEQGN
jgi:hypothetical protein